MNLDIFGQSFVTSEDLCQELYKNPEFDIYQVAVTDPDYFNSSVKKLHYDIPLLERYRIIHETKEEFDEANQSIWFMPDEYKNLDIAKYLLDLCCTEEELQRVGKELLMFQERGLLPLLQFMKYFVDTMRQKNVVWGVGRGSSVSSYVLFLIGVHKIDSLFYDLPIEEFLK